MERLTKVLVLALVVAMGATASAGLTYGMGGDWATTGSGWYFGVPAATDYAYMYRATVANPVVLAAGDTGALDYARFDLGGAWTPLGENGMVINGTATFGDGLGFDGLYFGADGAGLAMNGATINVGTTGVLNATFLKVTDLGVDAAVAYDIFVGGAANLGWIDYTKTDDVEGSPTYGDLLGVADLNLVITDLDATISVLSEQAAGLLADGIAQTNLAGEEVGILSDDGTNAVIGIVPEPATLALLGLGALVLRRKK